MATTYAYVGPKRIAERIMLSATGFRVHSADEVLHWLHQTEQEVCTSRGEVVATFVIDEFGELLLADRHSEHVACAGGRPVLSAGEITFRLKRRPIRVTWVTNQSTGYCPEPASWPAVKNALEQTGMPFPRRFSQEFIFRRCEHCEAINIVKDEVFQCGICSLPLPEEWNLSAFHPLKLYET